MFKRLSCVSAALLLCVPMAVNAKDDPPVDLSAFPETSKDHALPAIIDGLRRFLKDSSSITDFAMCTPPVKPKFKDGKLVRWTYLFSLNSKNAMGGYTGIQNYSAVFRPDQAVMISSITMAGNGDIEFFINRAIDRVMAKCPFVPNAEIQALLAGR